MDEIEKSLWNDYKNISNLIGDMSIVDDVEAYKIVLEDRDKIRNELIKLEQIKQEERVNNVKVKSENKRDNFHNIITVGSVVLQTGFGLFALITTFEFDKSATITSTLGRGILNSCIPKIIRK